VPEICWLTCYSPNNESTHEKCWQVSIGAITVKRVLVVVSTVLSGDCASTVEAMRNGELGANFYYSLLRWADQTAFEEDNK
jgi:hypothetical protein